MPTKLALVLAAVLAFTGCKSAPPTKVAETRERGFLRVMERAEKPLDISELTIVLDTRSRFDFGLNHVINAVNFQWTRLAEDEASGRVLRDPHQAALRLALVGVSPSTPVLVVGDGLNGGGEEGRLAWNLLYLGFQDVQVSASAPLRRNSTPGFSKPPQNVAPWKPRLRDDLQIGKTEFLNLASDPKQRLQKRVRILDVRSETEYFNMTGSAKRPDIHAINIEWKSFYNASGRPEVRFREKLTALDIQPADRIVVISNHGVRSGAVAYALLALGYTHVENFTLGWNGLSL